MRALVLYFAIAVATQLQHAAPARILGLFPHTGRSHQMVFEPLLQTLAERGHHVTTVSFFPLKNPPANYTDVNLQGISQLGLETVDLAMFETSNFLIKGLGIQNFLVKLNAFWPLDEFALSVCTKLVSWPSFIDAMKRKYDMVIVEAFNSDCMMGLLHVYGINAPVIAVSSTGFMPWVPDRLGLTDNPSHVPMMNMPITSKMDFWERLDNTIFQTYYKYWFRTAIQMKEQAILENHFGRKLPDLRDLTKNISLIFLNTFHTLNGVKPLLPGVIEVGGMHMDHTRKPIPQTIIIMEQFLSDCMFGLLHIYGVDAPIVGVSSCTISPWTSDQLGLTDNPSYVPNVATSFTAYMNYWQRLENTFLQLYFKYWFHRNVQIKEQDVIEKYFGRKIPDLRELSKNLSLILVNTHHSLNGVRPLLPGVVEVSGMHLVQTVKDIPPYIEKFINESEHGVVLLSFGSLIKTATLPKYKEEIIVKACAKLKQRVIWKYEDSGEEGTLTGNILRVRWLPQYELLQHPKVLAFVAHGGLLGMTEAVSAGKPMVVVPFFGDQPNNAAAATAIGMAKMISYDDLNEKDLSEAMQKVVSAEMRLRAKQVSNMWKDRIADPLETAVYWTERVIRWGHQDPLHSAARDMSFYEIALLDIAAVVLLAVVLLLLLVRLLISIMLKFLGLGRKKEKIH